MLYFNSNMNKYNEHYQLNYDEIEKEIGEYDVISKEIEDYKPCCGGLRYKNKVTTLGFYDKYNNYILFEIDDAFDYGKLNRENI